MKQNVCPICQKTLRSSYCDDCGMSFEEELDIMNSEAIYSAGRHTEPRPSSMQRQSMQRQTAAQEADERYRAEQNAGTVYMTDKSGTAPKNNAYFSIKDIRLLIILFVCAWPFAIAFLVYKLKIIANQKNDLK